MCDIHRVVLRYENGNIDVRDYSFSQFVEMTRCIKGKARDDLWDGKKIALTDDSVFARAGTVIKFVGTV